MTPAEIVDLQSQTYRHGETVWSETAVAAALAAPSSVAQFSSAGFAIGRIAGNEVELLLILHINNFLLRIFTIIQNFCNGFTNF